MAAVRGRCLVAGQARGRLAWAPLGLSFWGGVDPASGRVIDRHHPLHGLELAGRILAIPSGRGSCTGSAVLLELFTDEGIGTQVLPGVATRLKKALP